MKRASTDETPRERKRTKVVVEKEINFDELEAQAPQLRGILNKELPCARHVRIRTQISEIEIKWDIDKVMGEQHRNSIVVRNVPLRIMRDEPPLLEAVAESATDVRDLFLIDEFNGVGNAAAIRLLSEKGHWVSLERLSLWYIRDIQNQLGEFPVHDFSAVMPNVLHLSVCGVQIPALPLNTFLSKFPTVTFLALHNRTLKRSNRPNTPADISLVLQDNPIPNLKTLTLSGVSWSDAQFVDQYLTQHPLLEVLEFDASDMNADILRGLLAILPKTSITELRVYDLDPVIMPGVLVQALKRSDCKLRICKVIQPLLSKLSHELDREFTEAVKINTSLHSFPVQHSFLEQNRNGELERERQFYLKLNRVGRKYLYSPDIRSGLWPLILKRGADDSSIMHCLLKEKPYLIPSSTRVLEGE